MMSCLKFKELLYYPYIQKWMCILQYQNIHPSSFNLQKLTEACGRFLICIIQLLTFDEIDKMFYQPQRYYIQRGQIHIS